MQLNFEQIKELIPQRYPFLMIDRVLEVEPGKRAVSIKNVSVNEPFFQGHFPGKAVMPGALILEAMAQTAIILFAIAKKKHESDKRPIYYFGSVKARFLNTVIPGDQMKITVVNIKSMPSGAYVHGEAFVDEKKVSEAELVFSVKDE